MKLLWCQKCGDIFNLDTKEKVCSCGETKGRYIDDLNAEIEGDCQPIGISNGSFRMALLLQRLMDEKPVDSDKCCEGVNFEAFFINKNAKSITRL